MPQTEGEQRAARYRPRCETLPAFDLIGFTKIVASGGEQYGEVRGDGRWQVLRDLSGDDKTIYGVASLDKECRPEGHYRYTLAVKKPSGDARDLASPEGLFPMHIRASDWLIFALDSFSAQYGQFWQDNPYELVSALGWDFNSALGLHIDRYAASYASDEDPMEFMMPVKRRAGTTSDGQ